MSGPDKKKEGPDFEGLDWDSALDEWENKTFVPEVAKDVQTEKPAQLAGQPTRTPKPPSVRPAPLPPKIATAPPPPRIQHVEDEYEEDEGSGATVIAAIPRELLRGAGKAEDDLPRSARGGLGQLFSRTSDVPTGGAPESEPSAGKVTSRPPPPDDADPSVITSAKHVRAPASTRNVQAAAPLKRPSQVDRHEAALDEGGKFDPFAEPDTAVRHSVPSAARGSHVAAEERDPFAANTGAAHSVVAEADPFAHPRASEASHASFVDESELEVSELETTVTRKGGTGTAGVGDDGIDALLAASDDDEPTGRLKKDATAPGASTGRASIGPPLHVPDERHYDPNEETFVVSKEELGQEEIDLVGVGDEDDDESTRIRGRAASLSGATRRTWPDERPAREWLDAKTREAFTERAKWIEAEAREASDKTARARGLLVASELCATVGDTDGAAALAQEARDLAPSVVMSHRQARALMPTPRDPEKVVDALDLEAKSTPSAPARVQLAIMAADTLRTAGDDELAARRLDQAARIAPNDVRAPVLRAARALARNEAQTAGLRIGDAPELAPLAEALTATLRLRGVATKDEPTERSPNDALRRARAALDKGDLAFAAEALLELRAIPELARGATWLAAALGATRAATRAAALEWMRGLAESSNEPAKRALATRAMELGDTATLATAANDPTTFTPAERAVIASLVGGDLAAASADLDVMIATDALRALAAAIAATSPGTDVDTRAERTAGNGASRAATRIARLLASSASDEKLEAAIASAIDDALPAARALALEMAVRAQRSADVSEALAAWAAPEDPEARRDRHLASALVAERANDAARAIVALRRALREDPSCEAALRALFALDASSGERRIDRAAGLHALAEAIGEGPRAALLRLEALERSETLDDAARMAELEHAQHEARELPIASYLAERVARKNGSVEEVLRLLRDRRSVETDPLERALDAVREALFVAENDPALASERLEEAHAARPSDVALRELYERMAKEPLGDRGAWRESRAAEAEGAARSLFFLEAAHEHERSGDRAAQLRAAQAAALSDDGGLARVARDRAELDAGQIARLAEELLAIVKSTGDARERREAYERLAILDDIGRKDAASALLWHRSILEESPSHLPSLRHVEHALIAEGRDDELEPIAASIAKTLGPGGGDETTAHAELAARLRLRGPIGDWDATREMVDIAVDRAEPSLWSLRMRQAHARARGDDATFIKTTEAILERGPRAPENAALLVRAAEAATRMDDLRHARDLLERAAMEDPGDVVTWGLLADVRQRAGDLRAAAEACESLARTSVVAEHQLLAWYDAGRIWLDEVHDEDRGAIALEQAAAIDVTFQDTFTRLSALYATRHAAGELASLLERRIARATDEADRTQLEVERGKVLVELGDLAGARAAYESALKDHADHAGALMALADLCAQERDWEAAEQAWVRLARLLPTPDEQRVVYGRLGDLYSRHALNLSRAEVAYKEVLRRAPDDIHTLERLVDVYKRQNDSARAVELQQQLIAKAEGDERRRRMIELSTIYESTGHDNRKAEQALESARREMPMDVVVLRALVEFYQRHRQTPAVNILLDRVSADTRRALAGGKLTAPVFAMMATVFELRGKREAARIATATLAAIEGRASELPGAGPRALDPRLDDGLAPESVSPGLRALLAKTGDALDAAAPLDPRSIRATALQGHPRVASLAAQLAQANVQVLSSPAIGARCLPASSSPPTIVVGEALLESANENARAFLIARAVKLVQARAGALARTAPSELAVLAGAWLHVFNRGWKPQGIEASALAEKARAIEAALPRNLDADVGVIALEVAGSLGTQAATFGAQALAWANHVALLAIGDTSAAIDAIAMSLGEADGAPRDPDERAAWIARVPEAKDLIAFSVSDAYAEVRAMVGA